VLLLPLRKVMLLLLLPLRLSPRLNPLVIGRVLRPDPLALLVFLP
jgi:hypothetical protein